MRKKDFRRVKNKNMEGEFSKKIAEKIKIHPLIAVIAIIDLIIGIMMVFMTSSIVVGLIKFFGNILDKNILFGVFFLVTFLLVLTIILSIGLIMDLKWAYKWRFVFALIIAIFYISSLFSGQRTFSSTLFYYNILVALSIYSLSIKKRK